MISGRLSEQRKQLIRMLLLLSTMTGMSSPLVPWATSSIFLTSIVRLIPLCGIAVRWVRICDQ